MSEKSWDLDDVDPATREAIAAAAAEAGVSVEDYIAERLLLSLLVDAGGEDEPEQEIEIEAPAPAPRRHRESFAVGHRLDTIERRLGQTAAGVDEALAAFDTSLVALGARLDEDEAWTDENAETVDAALAELRKAVDSLGNQLDHTDASLDSLTRAHDALRAQVLDDGAYFDQRMTVVEEVARGAEAHGLVLAEAQESLKRAIGGDFIAYALANDEKLAEHTDHIQSAMVTLRDQTRAAFIGHVDDTQARLEAAHERIDTVADAAEAADARILADLLAAADTLSQRVATDFAAASDRIDAVFDHATDVGQTLARRADAAEAALTRLSQHADVTDVAVAGLAQRGEEIGRRLEEQFSNALSEQSGDLRASIGELAGSLEHARTSLTSDVRRLETNAEAALTRAHNALAAEINRVDTALGGELDRTREDLRGEIVHTNQRLQDTAAITRQLDAGLTKANAEAASFREAVDARFGESAAATEERFARARADMYERIDALGGRLETLNERAHQSHKVLSDEIIRVEASTLVALEAGAKARRDDVDALRAEFQQSAHTLTADLEHTQERVSAEVNDLRDLSRGVVARVNIVEDGLAACGRVIDAASMQVSALNTRMDQFAAKTDDTAIRESIAAIDARVGAVEGQALLLKSEELTDRIDELQTLIAAQAARAADDGGVRDALMSLSARLSVVEIQAEGLRQDDYSGRIEELRREIAANAAPRADAVAMQNALNSVSSRLASLETETRAPKEEPSAALIAELQAQIAAQDDLAAEAAERVAGLARVISDVSTHAADAETHATARLAKLEAAMSDLRFNEAGEPTGDFSIALDAHIGAIRTDLAGALEELHVRMLSLEQNTTAHDFVAIRKALEERHLALEAKTVRALDQLTRTVALLSRKFALDAPEEPAAPGETRSA